MLRIQLLTVTGPSGEQPQHFWLRGNLHLYNTCYMKGRAPFTHQLSYSGSYLLSGMLPMKNRKFFIQFANYICPVQAARGPGQQSEACRLHLLLEDGPLCSAVREALLALIIHEDAWAKPALGSFSTLVLTVCMVP